MPKYKILRKGSTGQQTPATTGIDQSTGVPVRIKNNYVASPDTAFFNTSNMKAFQTFAGMQTSESEEVKSVVDPMKVKDPYMQSKKKTGEFVRDIHNFYMDKAKTSTDQNVKLSAISSIKKMFPNMDINPETGDLIRDYNMPAVPGVTSAFDALKVKYQVDPLEPDVVKKGEYQSTSEKKAKKGIDPYVALDVLESPESKRIFDNVVNVYRNDVLTKNDPNKLTLLQEADKVSEEFTKASAKYTIDQINVGKALDRMDLTKGPANSLYKQWLVEDKGTSGSGLKKASIKSIGEYTSNLAVNPVVNEYADLYVNWAMLASAFNFKNPVTGKSSSEYVVGPADSFHEVAQEALGMNWLQKSWYGAENVGDLIQKMDEAGLNGKERFKQHVIDYWAKNGMDLYQGMDETMSTTANRGDSEYGTLASGGVSSYADIFQRGYEGSDPQNGLIRFLDNSQKVNGLPGYDNFYKDYSEAVRQPETAFLTYNPKGLGEITGEGGGGKMALPFKIDYDSSLPTTGELFLGDRPSTQNISGNSFLPSIIANFKSVNDETAGGRGNLGYADKPYLFKGNMEALIEELDPALDNEGTPADWDWDTWIATGLEDKHEEAVEKKTLEIVDAYLKDFDNYYTKSSEEKRPKGSIRVFPVAGGSDQFTGYEYNISGAWLKSKGYQEDETDMTLSMLIPKNKSNNQAYNSVKKSDWVDMAIQADGGISYNLPEVGNFTLKTKKVNGVDYYSVVSSYYNYDPTSGKIKQNNYPERVFEKSYYSGELLYNQLKDLFLNTQYSNENTKLETKANRTDLIYDPNQLLQQR